MVQVLDAHLIVDLKWVNISDSITVEMYRLVELPVELLCHARFSHAKRTIHDDDHVDLSIWRKTDPIKLCLEQGTLLQPGVGR